MLVFTTGFEQSFYNLEEKMDSTCLAALIGVIGTLMGIVIGWLLSLQSYKIGRTVVYGTLIVKKDIHCSLCGS